MELKKSNKANLEKQRFLFIEIGLVVALGVIFAAFELRSAPSDESNVVQQVAAAPDQDQVPITRQETPPPPPPEPPKVADILEIQDNSLEINTDLSIDAEADQDMSIDAPTYTASVAVEEEEDDAVLFAVIEEKPTFNGLPAEEGFRKWVGEHTNYPPVAQENGIAGKVFVEFTIGRDGSVSDVHLLRGVDPLLDAEAIRVIKSSPKWTPGKQRGKTVKVKYQFPVNFKLN